MSDNRIFIALISDTHAGSKYGLMSPHTVLFDEAENGALVPYTPELTAAQKYQYSLFQEHKDRTIGLAQKNPIVLFHLGDITHGNKHMRSLVSTRVADQVMIAAQTLREWLECPNVIGLRIVMGTEAHGLSENSTAVMIAEMLKHEFKDKDIAAVHHGIINIEGLEIDYSHHGPVPGRREYLKGNEARYYLRSVMQQEIMAGRKPPRLYIRGHYHEYITETLTIYGKDEDHCSTIILVPSYCFFDDYGRQSTRSNPYITNGMVVVETIDGEILRIHKLARTVDIRTKENYDVFRRAEKDLAGDKRSRGRKGKIIT